MLLHLSYFELKVFLINLAVKSQFNYCVQVWIFCSCSLNHIHERAIRSIYDDHAKLLLSGQLFAQI